ncbi:beta-barrel assembly-enhancing protease [mine drainage metagenome]|uniref:Beta-barrel assembly-enhancing protease n=1 Tax=mine drainage metagenome TaxID=410659 RepID=A0A1J5PB68_9ZZZZ
MHELQSLKSHAPDYADAWLIGGALAMQSDQFEPAQSQLQHFLDLVNATPVAKQSPQIQRERSQAFFSMARIAQQRKDFKQADLWLQRVDSADDLLLAQIRRASLMAQQGQVDQAIELIQRQPERSGDDAQLKRSAEVQILRDQKLFERARDRLQTFISQNPDDLDLVYDLAMVDEKLGNFSEMESSLRALMLTRPADPQAYNALGYSLADRNTRLDEALELINKALQLSPGDPFITDSLAWAEFRRGNVAVALTLLQKVFKEKPDVEIAAHLGEVLWANNQHQQAIEVFKQGIKLNPENETLNQTLQRLRVSL